MTITKSLVEKIKQEETEATERDMKLLESCVKDTKDYIIELITQNRYREGSKARFSFPKDVFLSKLEGIEPEVVTINAFKDCVKALVASELSGEGIHYQKGFNLPEFTGICSHFDKSVIEDDYYVFGLELYTRTEKLVCATLNHYRLHETYYGHKVLPFLYYSSWECTTMRRDLTGILTKINLEISKLDKSYVDDVYIKSVKTDHLRWKVGFEKDRDNKRLKRPKLSWEDTKTSDPEPEPEELDTTSPMTWIALTCCVALGLGLFALLIP